ncbi:MAG: tRNA (adenosine(37)-N6)-threonylcarbamoyltransferase complex dimerization subunit type 1 TsaB [Prevotella sp.]|nr:tRNA (adenosine(37)-N6)-threonylcarbamoyltransferase complex dimerization subunit type 1 TsaB [Bacteroides sp.]MCM1366739.1 tRNA (adenosine(37)-N6)-threonylcarbamoyltransferase complex dimerization subunit type 1 TsaB [Prevotella sp.]MCM1437023.1 tRNA (adenosine(37)-N6)-threonylcarbamoyltransferase complex dimerization subunit type 1 TsaB [Prevotella sp.]
MPIILNIETSSKTCSVALSEDGQILYSLEDTQGLNHATKLAPFVEKCMEELARKERKLDAVAVSNGPGSYTGLRIGLSLAKGLCFGLDIPLITLNTLEIMAVKAMFHSFEWQGDEIIIPMVDARRMEVYTAGYDFSLNEVLSPGPMILDENSYSDIALTGKKLILIGDGVVKAKDILKLPDVKYIEKGMPVACDMVALSEKYFRERKFADVAYSTPTYLKEWQPTSAPKPM